MTFQQPWWLLAALVLLIAYFIWKAPSQKSDWHRVIKQPVLRYLTHSSKNSSARSLALILATLSAIALANPSRQNTDSDTYLHAESWFVVADVSRSMSLEDVNPSRISALRDVATLLAGHSQARAIALIIYSGDAFMLLPPSFDTRQYHEQIALLQYGLIPMEGSNLTRALSLVASIIDSSQLLQSRIFILNDTGGINAKSISATAQLAARGHTTDIIVFGDDNKTPGIDFNLDLATELATAGNGSMVHADSMGTIELRSLDLSRSDNERSKLYQSGISLIKLDSLAHWVLLPGLIVVLAMFVRTRV